MRFDSKGLFWQDEEVKKERGRILRPMPPIPETGWRAPTYYPNLGSAKVLSVDVEACDPEIEDYGPFWARSKGFICGFSVGTNDGGRWYFPIRHTVEPETNLNPDHALAWLRDTLRNPAQPKVGANLLYDVGALRSEGIAVAGELVDVQFAEALLDERARVSLETLSQKYLGEGKTTDLLKKWIFDYYAPPKDAWRGCIYKSPPRLVGPYGEGDADLPLRLAPLLYDRLAREELYAIFKMECELIPLLVEMRYAGVSVDVPKAERLRDDLAKRAADEHKKLNALAGGTVDINASRSLAKAFDKAGLAYPKTAKGAPSFTKPFLKSVKHPIAISVQEIRRLEKLKTTFIESYILDSNINGKVYCSFHPLRGDEGGTRSGRFSSSNPNLQNIPIRDEELGKLIRGLFIPDKGHPYWRKYDYSQIEYRGLIHYAVGPGADAARAKFNENPNTDYHDWTQSLVEKETGQKIDRRPIKNLNFGIIYGMGEKKLKSDLNLKSDKEAKHFLEMYHKGVPFAKPTMKATMEEANRTGIITTILGRKSRFDLWEPADQFTDDDTSQPALPYGEAIQKYGKVRRAYIHKALNRRLQGTAADQMKVAMWRCWREGVFSATGVPRLTVHDELDFSDPGGRDEAFKEMKHILETAIPLRIPVRASCDIGPNWGELKELETEG